MRSVDFFPLLAGFWTHPGTGPDPRRCSGKETRIRSLAPNVGPRSGPRLQASEAIEVVIIETITIQLKYIKNNKVY